MAQLKQYVFAVTQSFKNLVAVYGLEEISDLDIGEEASQFNIFYKHLEAWFYDEELEELEIFVED